MLFSKLSLLINNENNDNVKKTKILKTLLMFSIMSMMLIPGGIIPVHAAPGDVILTVEINSSTTNGPGLSTGDHFGRSVSNIGDLDNDGINDIVVGANKDDEGGTNRGAVHILFLDGLSEVTNNSPVLDFIPNQSVDEDTSLDLLISATDADSDPISFGISPLLNFTSFVDNGNDTATFSANPGFSDSGVYNFNVTASDGTDDNTWQIFSLTVNDVTASPPLSNYWIDGGAGVIYYDGGNVGIGTTNPNQSLSVNGIIESTSGGFKFSDGTTQTTASMDTQLDQTDIETFGFVTGAHTVDTTLDQTDIETFGFVTGAHTVDTTLDQTDIETFGFVTGAHTVDTNFWTQSGSDLSYTTGNIGIGTSSPISALQVSGYIQLDTNSGEPPLTDCDSIDEIGRMKVDDSNAKMYVCVYNGSTYTWVTMQGATSIISPVPVITSLIADDPDDLDEVYSVDDIITITFDSDTNEPGGTGFQTKTAVDDLFTFTESLGDTYTGQWISADTFVITVTDVTGATPPIITGTTVTPTSTTTQILSADTTSTASTATSPVLSGNFGSFISSAPVITSLIADDPDDLDVIYSSGDIIVILFDSDTNTPSGPGKLTEKDVNDLFTFSEPLGKIDEGEWVAPDKFMITIKNTNNAGPPVVGITTVTPTGTTQILSADTTSTASTTTSPVLSGDFGETLFVNLWMDGGNGIIHYTDGNVGIGTITPNSQLEVTGYIELATSSGTPPTADCDVIDEIGRMKVDDTNNYLYVCTNNGWKSTTLS